MIEALIILSLIQPIIAMVEAVTAPEPVEMCYAQIQEQPPVSKWIPYTEALADEQKE